MTEYIHRNGETEPPTEEGHYWLEGKMEKGRSGGVPWFYEFGKGHDTLPFYVWPHMDRIYLDDSYTEPLSKFVGRFWGPVSMPVPPWEQP